jgi:tetratricopeptide (TPR) repeat protein
VLRLLQNDFAAAEDRAEKALAANPADVRALEVLMRCGADEKRLARALDAVRRHATQNKRLVSVQLFLGRVELQAGNVREARAAFEAAKGASPAALEADWSLIDLDIAERNFEAARRRIAPLLHGGSEFPARTRLALAEQTAGNHQAASEQYRKLLQMKPFDAGVLNNLAYILTEFLGKPAEALRYAQTAKEIEPENAAVDDTIGWTYYRMGRYAEAVRQLEVAVKRDPTARRHAHLAMAYARFGDGVRAKQTLRTALKMYPKLPEGAMAQEVVSERALASQDR